MAAIQRAKQLWRFTVQCHSFTRGASRIHRGGSFTLPIDHPDVKALRKDPRLVAGLMTGQVARPTPAAVPTDGPRFSRNVQVAFQQTMSAMEIRAAAHRNLSDAEREQLQELLEANRHHLARHLEGIAPTLVAILEPGQVEDLEAGTILAGELPEVAAGEPTEPAPAAVDQEPTWNNDPEAAAAVAAEDAARAELEAEAQAAAELALAACKADGRKVITPAAVVDAAAAVVDVMADLLAALDNPGGRTLTALVKMATAAGLELPAEIKSLRNRGEMIAGIRQLLAAKAAPSARKAGPPSPDSLGG